MKNLTLLIIIFTFITKTSFSQTFIEIEENNLLLGGKPSLPELIPIPYSELDSIFQIIRNENIEYRYVNGSCEDRAHYISLLLKKMNISSGKIWNFSPARMSLISKELFYVNDPFGVSDTVITWGYHVAPVLTAKNKNGVIDTLVIDQSFSPSKFIQFKDWLNKMNCSRSTYTFTDIDSYLFNSINGLVVYNNSKQPATSDTIPDYLPQIITGDFWQLIPSNTFVQNGLAINDLAYQIIKEADTYVLKEQRYLLNLIKDIDDIVAFATSERPEDLSVSTYSKLITYYQSRVSHWDKRYISIR